MSALNPVRAASPSHAIDWPWSSVRAHLADQADPLLARHRWPICLGVGLTGPSISTLLTKRIIV